MFGIITSGTLYVQELPGDLFTMYIWNKSGWGTGRPVYLTSSQVGPVLLARDSWQGVS